MLKRNDCSNQYLKNLGFMKHYLFEVSIQFSLIPEEICINMNNYICL